MNYSALELTAMQYSAVQWSAVQCSTVQYSSVKWVQCSTVQYSEVQSHAEQHNTVVYSAVRCFQYVTVQCSRASCLTLLPVMIRPKHSTRVLQFTAMLVCYLLLSYSYEIGICQPCQLSVGITGFCWMGEFCLFVELHRKGYVINGTTSSIFFKT